MPEAPTPYAVLMGDIVGSETAAAVATVHRVFNAAVNAANEAHAAVIASPLTITLGDEFQGLLRSLSAAWNVACALRLELFSSGVQCRFVIGSAHLETPLNTEKAWNMMGSGLAGARDKLNDKRSINAYRFSLPDEPIIEPLMDAVGHAITRIELGWTATQLEYVAASRRSTETNAELAKRLGVGARSLYKVLHAADADFHARQVQVLADAARALDARYGLQ